MTREELIDDAKHRMESAVTSLDHDLAGFRTGRASTALIERLLVPYYGQPTPLNQLATLATPEARQITIRPWDAKALPMIEKAILQSDVGITPSNDGQIIRLNIPALTEQRREELIKLAQKRTEEARVAVRNVRRDILHHAKELKLPEDVLHDLEAEAQKLTDGIVKEIERHLERKSAEIREV